ERPYHSDSTASRLLSEVKHCRARLVLRWGTTLESLVLFFFFIVYSFNFFLFQLNDSHCSHILISQNFGCFLDLAVIAVTNFEDPSIFWIF
ncbi:hypothetical protein ACHAWC_002697, partial [Mediolabrus comicus]